MKRYLNISRNPFYYLNSLGEGLDIYISEEEYKQYKEGWAIFDKVQNMLEKKYEAEVG